MKFRDFTKLPLVLALLSAAVGLAAYPYMPSRVPTHWAIDGSIDRWVDKSLGHVLMAPGILLGVYLLMLFAPAIDPKGANIKRNPQAYMKLTDLLAVFFTFLQVVLVVSAFQPKLDVSRIMFIGVGVLFVLIGNYLPKLPQNWFAGLRVPWTLDDEGVWKQANRFAGRLFFAEGLLFVATSFLPPTWMYTVMMVSVLGLVAVSFVYAYVVWRKRHPASA
jgi:uncharacterized membrane protein